MLKWTYGVVALNLAVGCQFGGRRVPAGDAGSGDSGAVSAGGSVGSLTETPMGTGDTDSGGSGGGASSGAMSQPGTGTGGADTAEDTTTTVSETSGDGASSSGTTSAVAESSSSDGAPLDDPYEDCVGTFTACYGTAGFCYDGQNGSVCVPVCPEGTCPAPLSGTATPICQSVVVGVGTTADVCGLACQGTAECPTGMQCRGVPQIQGARCVWP